MNNMSVRVVLAENKYECSTKNECQLETMSDL